jgi:hypothetical protein
MRVMSSCCSWERIGGRRRRYFGVRIGWVGRGAEERFDESGLAVFVAIFVEGFGDAVGVEGEGVARVKGSFSDFAIPFFENAEDGGGGVSRRLSLTGSRHRYGT